MSNKISIPISFPVEKLFEILKNLDLTFRLNIQWHVKSFNFKEPLIENFSYLMKVQYDRTDEVVDYNVQIVEYIPNCRIVIEIKGEKPRRFVISVDQINEKHSRFELEEISEEPLKREELMELNLWAKSIVDYAKISQSKKLRSRLWKFLLDKIYLRLSPSGRRIVFFVIVSEIFALLFFIMLVTYFLFFK